MGTSSQDMSNIRKIDLYIVLIMTIIFIFASLILGEIVHCHTLLLCSYQFIGNAVVVIGLLLKFMHIDQKSQNVLSEQTNELIHLKVQSTKEKEMMNTSNNDHNTYLKNTYGWFRIDLLTLFISSVLSMSFSFSIIIDAFQALSNIDECDTMQNAVWVLITGVIGLGIILCGFIFIGGSQHIKTKVFIMDNRIYSGNSACVNNTISTKNMIDLTILEMDNYIFKKIREIICPASVILCGLFVYTLPKFLVPYVDPLTSILAALLLMCLNFTYFKQTLLIMLETIPSYIETNKLITDLYKQFNQVINAHELHIWQLTIDKSVLTIHIVLKEPSDYLKLEANFVAFFKEAGITYVTIQPEFINNQQVEDVTDCLMKCSETECNSSRCCVYRNDNLTSISTETNIQPKIAASVNNCETN